VFQCPEGLTSDSFIAWLILAGLFFWCFNAPKGLLLIPSAQCRQAVLLRTGSDGFNAPKGLLLIPSQPRVFCFWRGRRPSRFQCPEGLTSDSFDGHI
jgi:hypothetical protein